MTTPTLAAVVVAAAVIGAILGWLLRGRRCRLRHAHLVAAYEPADLGTLFGDEEPPPVEADDPVEHVVPVATVPPGPYDGSALPGPDGCAPDPAYVVKAKTRSRIYHPPSSPSYARTVAEVWFRTPEDAEAAGFRAPKQRVKGSSTS